MSPRFSNFADIHRQIEIENLKLGLANPGKVMAFRTCTCPGCNPPSPPPIFDAYKDDTMAVTTKPTRFRDRAHRREAALVEDVNYNTYAAVVGGGLVAYYLMLGIVIALNGNLEAHEVQGILWLLGVPFLISLYPFATVALLRLRNRVLWFDRCDFEPSARKYKDRLPAGYTDLDEKAREAAQLRVYVTTDLEIWKRELNYIHGIVADLEGLLRTPLPTHARDHARQAYAAGRQLEWETAQYMDRIEHYIDTGRITTPMSNALVKEFRRLEHRRRSLSEIGGHVFEFSFRSSAVNAAEDDHLAIFARELTFMLDSLNDLDAMEAIEAATS